MYERHLLRRQRLIFAAATLCDEAFLFELRQDAIQARRLFRVPACLADFVTVLLVFELVRLARPVRGAAIAAILVACSPVLFVVSGFHGNTDPVFVMFSLLSVYVLVVPRWASAAGVAFGIAVSTAVHWVRRYRATGSVAPGKIGGHKKRVLRGEHAAWLRTRCREREFTISQLVEELLAARALRVDRRQVWEFLHAERLSFKKKPVRKGAGSSRRRPAA